MKKKCFLLASLTALLLASCSNEDSYVDPNGGGKGGLLTFNVQGIGNNVVSYADPIADASENSVDNFTIYMFSSSNLLEEIYKNVEVKDESGTNTVTIDATGKKGTKTLYFVANGNGRSQELVNIEAGITKMSDFIESISDKDKNYPVIPLLMSGVTTVTDVEQPPTDLKVTLERRVARFDIENDSTVTNFRIDKILINEAKLGTYIFNVATGTPSRKIETGKYNERIFTPKDPQNPVRMDSVFYLYPTEIGTGATQISFEGAFYKGEIKVYNLELPSPVEIKANHRYILKVKKVNIKEFEFEIEMVEWAEGEEEEAKPNTDLVEFSPFTQTDCAGLVIDEPSNTFDITNVSTAGTISFTTTSYSRKGTTASIAYTFGKEADMPDLKFNSLNTDPIITYGATYVQKYEIEIPAQTATKIPLEMVVTIQNNDNPDQKKVITISSWRYPGTAHYPVLFGGIYWAPVNVGATEITDPGTFHQWGRNYGALYGTMDDIYPTPGPVTAAVANGDAKDKFIMAQNTPYDWLNPKNDNLWGGANTQGPCPTGWRLPTKVELDIIATAYNGSYQDNTSITFTNARLEIKGDKDGEYLYLPASGIRAYNLGNYSQMNIEGYYWSSTAVANNNNRLYFNKSILDVENLSRAWSISVRCVKN